jgi:two-component system cell cycle sensor histidine kinase PleC
VTKDRPTAAIRVRALFEGFAATYRASYAPSNEAEAKLVDQQLALACEATRATGLVVILASLSIAVASVSWIPLWRIALWLVLWITAMIASGFYYQHLLKGSDGSIADVRARARAFTWLSFLQTAVWCSLGILLRSPDNPMNHLIVGLALLAALACWTATGTYHFATGVTALPVFLAILTAGAMTAGRFGTAAALLGFWILMMGLFRSNYKTRERMIVLEHERGRLIENLRQANTIYNHARLRAETASRAKSAFLANMSHELRTPLNAILGFSEIIQTRALGPDASEQYAEYGGYIHGSGPHLLLLINDILDLAKIESGRLELRETDLDLNALMSDAIQMLSVRAEEGGINLSVEANGRLPLVFADERAIRQILANLISNAVKFTPNGGLVTVFAALCNDGALEFGVQDTGVGIAPEDQERVFESFGQGRHDAVVPDKGTGLGLPIVKGLAEAHGGSVALKSAAGKGTCVTVRLPSTRVRPLLRAAV